MAQEIHPTAIVEQGAQIAADVRVGAYAYVGAQVVLGSGSVLHHHATVDGNTHIGDGCEIFPHACIGLKTQDLKFKGGNPGTRIGSRNVFREFCTVHAATYDGDFTRIGEHNHFLAYAHVAHDCVVGSHNVFSNSATLAGHVTVSDHVVMGGFAAAHQFCRIGSYVMVGGMSKIVQDVAPFLIADGNPATIRSFNKVGLERAGFTAEQISAVKTAYRIFYREDLNRTQAIEQLSTHEFAGTAEVRLFLEFASKSERGLVTS